MNEVDTVLMRRIGGEGLALYDSESWNQVYCGLRTDLKEKSIREATLIRVPNWQDHERRGSLLIADQFRLRILDEEYPNFHVALICTPDRPLAYLHARHYLVVGFVRKLRWRVRATLQIWGILPMDRLS